MKKIIDGFRFGMLLQLAVGPITLLIFQTSVSQGFLDGLQAMLGAGLADALFVGAAILGLGSLMTKYPRLRYMMTWFGGLVLIIFGTRLILSLVNVEVVPSLNINGDRLVDASPFIRIFLLTLANPLTVVFWTGVFGARVAKNQWEARDLWLFGGGAVSATLFFQSLVVILGLVIKVFLPDLMMAYLNGGVGLVLIYFGIKLLLTKKGEVVQVEAD